MKTVKALPKPMKMKYKQIGSFEFAQTLQRLGSKEWDNNKTACHIHRIVKEVEKHRQTIINDHQKDIVEEFGKRHEEGPLKGQLIRPEGEPRGFDPKPDCLEAMAKAMEKFDDKEFEISVFPLTLSELQGFKLSARDVELLGPLFTEEDAVSEGPGVPQV